MDLIIIHEEDMTDNEMSVIGVAETPQKAEEMILGYYGSFETKSYRDIRDSNLEYEKILEVLDHENKPYEVKIVLEWSTLNSIY